MENKYCVNTCKHLGSQLWMFVFIFSALHWDVTNNKI